jgi:hypothetical protein
MGADQLAAQLQLQQQQEEEQAQEQQHRHTLSEMVCQLLLAPRNER